MRQNRRCGKHVQVKKKKRKLQSFKWISDPIYFSVILGHLLGSRRRAGHFTIKVYVERISSCQPAHMEHIIV